MTIDAGDISQLIHELGILIISIVALIKSFHAAADAKRALLTCTFPLCRLDAEQTARTGQRVMLPTTRVDRARVAMQAAAESLRDAKSEEHERRDDVQ